MANMSSKFDKNLNRIILQSTWEFYTFINEIGGDIDMVAYKPMLSMNSYRVSGEKIEMPMRRRTPDTLKKFNLWYDIDVNVDLSYRNGGQFVLIFNSTPNLQEDVPEEEKEPVDVFADFSDAVRAAASEVIDVVSETVEDVVEKVTELEVPNWSKLSSPTTGKKKLVESAKKHGITLDATRKYKEMVEDFKEEFIKKGE